MYRQSAFREDRPDILHGLIRDYPLATLVTHGDTGLDASLVPFTLAPEKNVLRAHLARGNSQIDDLRSGSEALLIFQGPQAYITPSWYPAKQEHGKVVPTWNYVVAQVWGKPRILDEAEWLRAQIDALTRLMEEGRETPWQVSDAPADFITAQLKGIVGLEIPISRIEGKWKTSQNQSAPNRAGVVAGLTETDPHCPMAAIVERRGAPI